MKKITFFACLALSLASTFSFAQNNPIAGSYTNGSSYIIISPNGTQANWTLITLSGLSCHVNGLSVSPVEAVEGAKTSIEFSDGKKLVATGNFTGQMIEGKFVLNVRVKVDDYTIGDCKNIDQFRNSGNYYP